MDVRLDVTALVSDGSEPPRTVGNRLGKRVGLDGSYRAIVGGVLPRGASHDDPCNGAGFVHHVPSNQTTGPGSGIDRLRRVPRRHGDVGWVQLRRARVVLGANQVVGL